MAALAYLLLPITGLVAYLIAADPRTRFHGLQAILIGLVWPLALYGASTISASITRVVFAVGALVWVSAMATAASGRDLRLPGVRRYLQRISEHDPREGVS